MMRVTTSQYFRQSLRDISTLNVDANRLQTQIATGKKLQTASDDAAAYQRLSGLRALVADDVAYSSNISLAQGVLSQADTALAGTETQLQRVNELIIQAANDTLSADDRVGIATALDAIREDLLRLANATDVRGQPLFGGASGDVAFETQPDGSITYAGSGEAGTVPVADGVAIQTTEDGGRIFGGAGQPGVIDIFAMIATYSAALRSGADVQAPSATALSEVNSALDQVSAARSMVGARAYRLDLERDQVEANGLVREELRSALEDTDVSAAITELQKTLTILQATQSSFARLSDLSLFNYLS
ncbi:MULTISPECIES: flagellar hook-associated protein FlgL [unclassified Sphingomonas]|jgi:flagellar hook-associated protein 3 FlgL|uniref:flagellar hook-associated protein FlgL n=1 Tax=unclassified Sphingomonas TaxID=196159 RepID=UPI000836C54F|nr:MULTISPECIES: flagellar hook-associated protein FlgL [unclassified Sphingomonas]MCH4894152.1 flagellar hook-associated protein 3 [Sphingomonas sp. SFZ2018-12]